MHPEFIPGIFNYCDKCCDRCAFATRCSIFPGVGNLRPEFEMSNEQLLNVISDKLKGLSELFEQRDVFLSITSETCEEPDTNSFDEEEILEPVIEGSSLVSRSRDYCRQATIWLKNRSLDPYVADLQAKVRVGIKTEDEVSEELDILQELLNEIQRFTTFIPAKLKRALFSARTLRRWEKENGLQNDCDGSAKIALIAIERSMESWKKILHEFPTEEDDCLAFLVDLQHLQGAILDKFPNAPHFVRPGFDESNRAMFR
jgi:hypothetical protein